MAEAQVKNFDSPDETRPFEGKGKVDILNVEDRDIGRGVFEPGWKWSENVKPIAETDSCQVYHLGYCLSGGMTIYMDGGGQTEIGAGDVFVIPPGHDAEVTGDEPCVLLDFGSDTGDYAKRT